MSFKDFKRDRGSSVEKLLEKAKQEDRSGGGNQDPRMWQPTATPEGNGSAVIRFLPGDTPEDVPWVRYWSHGFKGPTGQWYIEKSRTSLGPNEADPVAEANTALWEQGEGSEGRRLVSGTGPKNPGRKRKLHYVSNILVISDPANEENEGKVFMFQHGAKIHGMVVDAMEPEFEDEQPVNVCDFWEGANFRLKFQKVDGQRSYDKSKFDSPSALFDGDEDKLEEVYNNRYDLSEFTDPAQYKSYDELKKRLDQVLGVQQEPPASEPSEGFNDDEIPSEPEPSLDAKSAESPEMESSDQGDDDDGLSYFKNLAEQD